MNSDDQISAVELPPAASDLPESADPGVETDSSPPNPAIQQSIDPSAPAIGASGGNGFVARLPRAIRDQLNQMMLDGVSYPQIIKRLGDPASHLRPSHLTEWKKRGHQDWLLHQDWLAERRIRQESAGDILDDCDPNKVNQGALQLGTLYIYDALRDLRAGGLESKLGGDSAAFARLLNALSRASRETLQLQKYRDVCARARVAIQELKDPKRKLNESETRAIVLKVDDILGLSSDEPDEDTPPTASDPSPDNHSVTA
jgi:hypothetical protein